MWQHPLPFLSFFVATHFSSLLLSSPVHSQIQMHLRRWRNGGGVVVDANKQGLVKLISC